MAKNTSVILGEHFTSFVEAQVTQGRYSNASDVMRAGLSLLEEKETTLASRRAALIESEQSGIGRRSVSDIWSAAKEDHRANGELRRNHPAHTPGIRPRGLRLCGWFLRLEVGEQFLGDVDAECRERCRGFVGWRRG